MTKTTFTVALLIALAVPPLQAQAACKASDLGGRWDVYGMADTFGFGATFDCVFAVNSRGRAARSICIARAQGEKARSVNRGSLRIRSNCLISGQINGICEVNATMTRNKDVITGVYNCDATGEVALFTMVRR